MSAAQFIGILLAIVSIMMTVLADILIYNARLTDLRRHLDVRFDTMERRFDDMLNRWPPGTSSGPFA